MKRFIIIMSVLLTSCGGESLPETVCSYDGELPFNDMSVMCSRSEKCVTGNHVEYNRHVCFCDKICLCFHSTFHMTNTCTYVNDPNCKRHNYMSLAGGKFCLLPKNDREIILKDLDPQNL